MKLLSHILFITMTFGFLSACGGGSGGGGSSSSLFSQSSSCSTPQTEFSGSCNASQNGRMFCAEYYGLNSTPGALAQFEQTCAEQGGNFSIGHCPTSGLAGACKMDFKDTMGAELWSQVFFYYESMGMTADDVQEFCSDFNDPEEETMSAEFCI